MTWCRGESGALSLAFAFALSLSIAATKASNGKVEFEQALRFYDAQEYDAALPYFQKAYELSGRRASAIRALAQCERALKKYDEAIAHFREYLAVKPRPADAASVEETIKLIDELRMKALAEKDKEKADAEAKQREEARARTELVTQKPPEPQLAPKVETSADRTDELVPWFVAGGGAVAAIAGGVLFALGRSDVSTVEGAAKGTHFKDVSGANDRAPLLTGTGTALAGVGVAAIALGVYWLVTEAPK